MDDEKYRDELAARISTVIRVGGLIAKNVQSVILTLSKSAISNLRGGHAESISISRLQLLAQELSNINPSTLGAHICAEAA